MFGVSCFTPMTMWTARFDVLMSLLRWWWFLIVQYWKKLSTADAACGVWTVGSGLSRREMAYIDTFACPSYGMVRLHLLTNLGTKIFPSVVWWLESIVILLQFVVWLFLNAHALLLLRHWYAGWMAIYYFLVLQIIEMNGFCFAVWSGKWTGWIRGTRGNTGILL